MEVVRMTMYKCGICGSVYDTQSEAEECEERHRAFESIKLLWEPTDGFSSHPETIDVTYKSNSIYPRPYTVRYKAVTRRKGGI